MITKKQAYEDMLAKEKAGGPWAVVSGACVYDPDTNGGCAIGRYLVDLYSPEMDDGHNARDLFEAYPQIAELFEDPWSAFWNELQYWHDEAAGWYGDVERGMVIPDINGFQSSHKDACCSLLE